MSKLLKKISIIIAVLLVSVLTLVACSFELDPLTGGDATATTTNNNSYIVTQGEHIYYINGYVGSESILETEDNTYGNVTKGAIYRANLDGTDSKVLVPQIAFDKNTKNAINIFGGYLYFTSPSISSSKEGDLQTNFTEFYRVKIDGTELEKITTVQSDIMEYKFTDKGLYYIEGSSIMYITYDGKIGDPVEVEDSASETLLTTCETYTPGGVNTSMYSVFAKTPEDIEGDPYNTIVALTSNGEIKEILNGSESKSTYSVKNVDVEGNNLVVYYEKTITKNSHVRAIGLFAMKFDKDLNPIDGSEKQLTVGAGKTVRYISYDAGVYVTVGTEMYIPTISTDGLTVESKIKYTINPTIAPSINTIRMEGDKLYMYYIVDSALFKIEMNIDGITNTYKTGFIGNAEAVIEKNIKTDGMPLVIVGNTVYYTNTAYLNYMYSFDMSTDGAKHNAIAVRTEEDTESYIDLVEAMGKDTRIAHDKLIAEDIEDILPWKED